jgi:hypothetical protein
MHQIKNKVYEAIERLKLDLKGKIVLTEAATGAYIVTPVIAALAGAEVYAFTRNTKYGTVEEVKKQTNELMAFMPEKKLNLTFIDSIDPVVLGKADIITNSGHLRPLNAEKLRYVRKGVAIPLMYEAWEWRDGDLDIHFCKDKGILVGATNERHPDIDVFNFLGDMALKMIFDAGLCLYKNYFILISNNDFGPFIAKVLSKVCRGLAVCDLPANRNKYEGLAIDWIGDFPDISIPEKYRKSDAVIFTAYPFDRNWIGDGSQPISAENLSRILPDSLLLRYAGDIDEDFCKPLLQYYPERVHSGHMGILPSAIGFDPIIRLQSGGLKVGEMILAGEKDYNGESIVDYL